MNRAKRANKELGRFCPLPPAGAGLAARHVRATAGGLYYLKVTARRRLKKRFSYFGGEPNIDESRTAREKRIG